MAEKVLGSSASPNSRLKSQFKELDDSPAETRCLLCETTFVLPTNEKDFLTHIFKEHRLVIGDVEKIASLKSYVSYWRIKFREEPLTTYCTSLLMNCTPDGKPSKNEPYFLLSDCISEDKTLREELQRSKLEWILAEQLRERNDTKFKRGCMFCRCEFSESRLDYIKHLSEKHNIWLGKPQNLVLIDQLLDKIQNSIESLICIYCEKEFKDRSVLKEHMRKKLHKRINPNNKSYDKFYITNYLEPGSWREKQDHIDEMEDPSGFSSENEDETWSDWDSENVDITCLFCDLKKKVYKDVLSHMKTDHNVDFEEITKDVNFYQKVKIVNYLRKQIYVKKCIFCDNEFEKIVDHMKEKEHFKLPSKEIWDQPEFYFPMYENDSFLYNLDSNSKDDGDSGSETCEIFEMEFQRLKNGETEFENSLIKIKVVGLITTIAFQKARLYALKLHRHLSFKFSEPEIIEMLQFDWHEYLQKLQLQIGGRTWILKRQVAVFIEDEFIGNDVDFYRIISHSYTINLPTSVGYYESFIVENYRRFCEKTNRTFVYFTFGNEGETIGSALFMLYSDYLPRTCEYFTSFCNGKNLSDGTIVSYKGNNIHRIAKNGWIQSGDIENNFKSELINELIIPEESFCISHNRRGVLSLSNSGKNANGPQFIISLKSNSWMDYNYVAFGQLVDGDKSLKLLEQIPTDREKPLKNIKILYCGEYSFKDEPTIFKDKDAFLDYKLQDDGNETSAPSISIFNKFPDIQPWLYNISDRLDLRDVPSILMAERYLKGLYCLTTDFLPGMDMNIPNQDCSKKKTIVESKTISPCDITNLLTNLEIESTDPELRAQIQNICRKIVYCALEPCVKKDCLETTVDKKQLLLWILGIAQEMIVGVVKKTEKSESHLEITNLEKKETEKSLSLIEKVLKSASSLVFKALTKEEDTEGA